MTSQLIKKKNQIYIAEKKKYWVGTILMGWSEYIKQINV